MPNSISAIATWITIKNHSQDVLPFIGGLYTPVFMCTELKAYNLLFSDRY